MAVNIQSFFIHRNFFGPHDCTPKIGNQADLHETCMHVVAISIKFSGKQFWSQLFLHLPSYAIHFPLFHEGKFLRYCANEFNCVQCEPESFFN